ncbi:hypothetical protein TSUD_90180 [Trifolium subterraneum]|uniref:Uncharacterized protein n=1 Tax=Trifolium subterraneum TaxID=3900 RepID=A0A2Z6NZJ3_TRISU|nr:hypothetical protein TSUD_90180 [Trifolium subterraneum]
MFHHRFFHSVSVIQLLFKSSSSSLFAAFRSFFFASVLPLSSATSPYLRHRLNQGIVFKLVVLFEDFTFRRTPELSLTPCSRGVRIRVGIEGSVSERREERGWNYKLEVGIKRITTILSAKLRWVPLAIGRKKILNIGCRILKESNQGSNATHTTSTQAQGNNIEETRRTSTHAQGSTTEENHRTSTHTQGSGAEETLSNPTQMEDDTHEFDDSHSIPSDIEAEAHIEKGRPTGQEGTSLTRFIGSMARRKEYASIGYISWKDMSGHDKSAMLKLIESKFEFVPPINDTTREMLKTEINDKWRQWKTDLKSNAYDPSKSEEEIASVKPDSRVDLGQWRQLVHHWFSEEGQEELNKYDNEAETSQSIQEIQSDMPWKDDIYSKVKDLKREDECVVLARF